MRTWLHLNEIKTGYYLATDDAKTKKWIIFARVFEDDIKLESLRSNETWTYNKKGHSALKFNFVSISKDDALVELF